MPSRPPENSRRLRILFLLAGAAALLTAILAFPGLGRHVFWDDEALTAFCARNYLETGKITAWDGTNIAGFLGGMELDENLEVIFVPPQQYWLAAAGMALWEDEIFGARFFFVVLGIACVFIVAWWSHRFFGAAVPWPLPAFILALSPQFLLYIRNCRYYSPAVFWTLGLLALWTPPFAARKKNPGKIVLLRHLAAAAAVIGLFTTHTLHAVCALAVLPVFFLEPRYRNRSQIKLLGTIYGAGIAAGIWFLSRGNTSDVLLERRGNLSNWIAETFHLLWWHVRDMGIYEFFAWPVLLLLLLPWKFSSLAGMKPLARSAAVLVASIFAYLAVTAVFTPQTTEHTSIADMRYVLPTLAIGSLISAAGLCILWKANRWLALGIGVLLVFTNLFHLGATQIQSRHVGEKWRVRSSLYDHVYELTHPYDTTLDSLVKALGVIPPNSSIYFQPETLCFTAMFHAPQHRYASTLRPDKKVNPEIRAKLSNHVYIGAKPDFVFIPSSLPQQPLLFLEDFRAGKYPLIGNVKTHIFDEARPDMLNHWFYLPPPEYRDSGFYIYARPEAPRLRPGGQ